MTSEIFALFLFLFWVVLISMRNLSKNGVFEVILFWLKG